MHPMAETVTGAARAVLGCGDPHAKARLARKLAEALKSGCITEIGAPGAPDFPARPDRPRRLAPRDMPKRRAAGSPQGRIALYHALAHIELNAIDLAFDLVARFAGEDLPWDFYADWIAIGAEEAHHFEMLNALLEALDIAYGDLPAHGGLWEAAAATDDDLLARLAVVPLVLEARGLDVTPGMIVRLGNYGDIQGKAVLEVILAEEIGHVAAGRRWFEWLAGRRGLDAPTAWDHLVRTRFKGNIKTPLNEAARAAAGFGSAWHDTAPAP
jgi:uncharacterized ferritin-like protein (DUF455 family)